MDKHSNKPAWVRASSIVIVVLMPLVLLLGSVRMLLSESLLRIEYSLPGFPEDSYGFTLADRLHWAPIALDYLLNDEDIEYLEDLKFETGEPVFNSRELRHMDDVKRLTQGALMVFYAALGGVAVLCLVLLGTAWGRVAVESLGRGALVTLLAMLALGLGLALAFSVVFVGFHRIFFEGDTWLFRYSDTLIRLFPERFWRDAFIFVVGLTTAGAGTVMALSRLATRPRRGPEQAAPETAIETSGPEE